MKAVYRCLILAFLLLEVTGVGSADTDSLPPLRRVHAVYFADGVRWAESGIFWFGRVDPPGGPGLNYADVRVAYTDDALRIYVNVEDYYVWYDTAATSQSDLTRYDGVAVYLDTHHDRAGVPQPDDYYFLSGLCLYGCGDGSAYRRQARGTGGGWDVAWQGAWEDDTFASWWCNPGPNGNECGIDFGWWSYLTVPWSTLGLSGPPPQGTAWGLGVILYDRDDQPPAGAVSPETWPETFDAARPSTWGEVVFGPTPHDPPEGAYVQGTTVIRRGLDEGMVEDAWVGGGGTCSGGHEGDPDGDNHGSDPSLFVANQSLIADFPCFSKSYLRFDLSSVPLGKVILSATLTLHHWGNALPDQAQPSLIWLFTVDGGWGEGTLTWNNAPLARENLSATWVDVLAEFPGWPGVRYDWDATQAVAEAYGAGAPLNVALYTADVNLHSSKYFAASEQGDWNAVARPTLTVVWGEPVATLQKEAHPTVVSAGGRVTYTLHFWGNGQPLTLTDDLPDEVTFVGPIRTEGGGSAAYVPGAHRVTWTGEPALGHPVTLTFPVSVLPSGPLAVWNTGVLSDASGQVSEDLAVFIVGGYGLYLPMVLRSGH